MLLLQEPPPLFIDKSLSGDMGTYDFYPMPRSSLHSVRKASYDVRSLGSDGTQIQILQPILSLIGETNELTTAHVFVSTLLTSCSSLSLSLAQTGAIIRRQSLARLHSMAIEGPITKVINIITAAQESSPNYISQALDKVRTI